MRAIRLGPLAVEQKKRVVGKRARFEKNKEDERKPQELREEDIARSENETTKHVIDVSSPTLFFPLSSPPFLPPLILIPKSTTPRIF